MGIEEHKNEGTWLHIRVCKMSNSNYKNLTCLRCWISRRSLQLTLYFAISALQSRVNALSPDSAVCSEKASVAVFRPIKVIFWIEGEYGFVVTILVHPFCEYCELLGVLHHPFGV